jgi:hypothetical protein
LEEILDQQIYLKKVFAMKVEVVVGRRQQQQQKVTCRNIATPNI